MSTSVPGSPRRGDRLRRRADLRFGVALLGVGVAYLARRGVDPVLGDRSGLEFFLAAVAFAAWFGGLGPALVATAVSVLVGTWSFVPPRNALWIYETADKVEAAAFVAAAVFISWLVKSLREAQARAEEHGRVARERQSELVEEIGHRALAEGEVQALAAENDRQRMDLQTVLATAPVAVWVAHDRQCRQVTGNPLAHALFGGWEGSKEVRIRAGGVDLPPEERPLYKAAATGAPALRAEFELVSAGGKVVWVQSNAVPLLDEQGAVRGAVSIWADITALKEAETEVRHLNTDLERRVDQRTEELRRALDELTSYAYSIAHDLRTPLRAISGLTEILVEENQDRLAPSGLEYSRRIVGAAQSMDEMILDLLLYSRISRNVYPVQEVDPYEVCAEAIHRLSGELQRRSAEVQVDGPMAPVLGHRELLLEVFLQLLSNSVKFVEEGTAPRVKVWAQRGQRGDRIWIEDNGIGIRSEYRERIFGVFQKLHRPEDYPGTGIGLAIVRRAVQRMDGRCGVESESGRGSRFWIELPVAPLRKADGSPAAPERAYLKF